VLEETGCACSIGNYLGTISYSDQGVPKVVLFWKMSVVDDKSPRNEEEIGEAVWLQIPAAIERLSHPQEKARLSRMGIIQRQATNTVVKTAEAELPATPAPVQTQRPSKDDNRAHARLLREAEAFRVELGFLERRNVGSENPWAAAAHEQLNNVQRCLESNDVE